ncbi:hypothetical protein R1flu_007471 [Riccia fluitans]|uniref:Uncharacterized protein n=1 Tax=Riccia fluitans TaxID=41844 RepID=A0ABD1Z335_9MARC
MNKEVKAKVRYLSFSRWTSWSPREVGPMVPAAEEFSFRKQTWGLFEEEKLLAAPDFCPPLHAHASVVPPDAAGALLCRSHGGFS